MNIGFDGIVNGIYTVYDCVLLRLSSIKSCIDSELMCGLLGGYAFSAVSAEDAMRYTENVDTGERAEVVCPCNVVRIFGIGLVGGGVLCKVLRILGECGICVYGASASECGIALALPREKSCIAVDALSRALLCE